MYDLLLKLAGNPYFEPVINTDLSCSNEEVQNQLITDLNCKKEMACETHVFSACLEI